MYKYRDLDMAQTEPWEQMAHTFAWVREQQIAEMLRKNEETVQWFMERHKRHMEKRMSRVMEDAMFSFERDIDTETWLAKAREEEARRAERRARRDAEKLRAYQDELRRLQKRKKSDNDKRVQVKAIREAWSRYESRWAKILGDPNERVVFGNIPWPLMSRPQDAADITTDGIREFLFSGAHSPNQSQKERVRAALRLWHPDKFHRVLGQVEQQ
jgi:hypothetical protein